MRGARGFLPALVIVGFAVALPGGTVLGQPLDWRPARGGEISVAVGARFESWTADAAGPDGEPLRQASAYISASVPVTNRFRFGLVSGGASTTWGAGYSLHALHDTQALLSYRPRNDVLLRFGANLPTGRRSLNPEELRIARGMSDRTMALAVPEPGEGFDMQLGAAWSFRVAAISGAAGASYLRKGRYEALDSQGRYQPGDQYTGALSAEGGSRALYVRNSVSLTVYGKDSIDGQDVFQFGNRWRLEALAGGSGGISWQLRGRGVLQDANSIAAAGSLDRGYGDEPGPGWYVDGTAGVPAAYRTTILAIGGARFISGGSDGIGGGRRFDLGAGAQAGLSQTTSLIVRGRYSFGRLDISNELPDVNLSGFGLDVRLEYHR